MYSATSNNDAKKRIRMDLCPFPDVNLVDSIDSTARYGNAVVISNLGRLQIEQFTYGGHFRVSGKIITPLTDDFIYLNGKLSKPSLLESNKSFLIKKV